MNVSWEVMALLSIVILELLIIAVLNANRMMKDAGLIERRKPK